MSEKLTHNQNENTYPLNADDAEKRRKTVKRILIGVGAVGAVQYWTKPIVESVVLPSHSVTTTPPSPPSESPSSPPPVPPPKLHGPPCSGY